MSTRKPSIPGIHSLPPELARVIGPLKENLEIITGTRGGEIDTLAKTATTAEIIEKINDIIVKLNASGT